MTVTLTSLGASVTRAPVDQSVKLSAVLNNIAPATQAKSVDASAAVQVDESPQSSQAVTLRVQSVSVAFSATKLDVIDSGATQVLRILGQLQSLASRAGLSGLSESERTVLNGQFQALKFAINNVPPSPPGSEFTASSVLGNLAPEIPAQDANATLGGFLVTNLFGDNEDTNIATPEAAQAALEAIASASAQITGQRDTISRLQGVTEFAAAAIDGALQNQEAANATFDDGDATLLSALQTQAATVQAAQTARLPNNILQLLAQ